MSYDTHLYFADAEFPRARWNEVLGLFEVELLEPQPKLFASCSIRPSLATWIVREERASFECELRDIRGAGYIDSGDANWCISTHSTKGAGEVFACVKLVYAALSWIEGTRWSDGYFDLFCHSVSEFNRDCVPRLERWFVSQGVSRMFELGILDGDGKLLL